MANSVDDDNDFWDLISQVREHFPELEPTPDNIHAAAVGLAGQLYRNTEAVEHYAHAAGPWSDNDMLRMNARVTELCRVALTKAKGAASGDLNAIFETLLGAIIELLPKKAGGRLRREKGRAPDLWAELVRREGIGLALTVATMPLMYTDRWWGALKWPSLVDDYCSLADPPPDPATFRDRMLHAPWELSDAQARFVTEHRYDVGRFDPRA